MGVSTNSACWFCCMSKSLCVPPWLPPPTYPLCVCVCVCGLSLLLQSASFVWGCLVFALCSLLAIEDASGVVEGAAVVVPSFSLLCFVVPLYHGGREKRKRNSFFVDFFLGGGIFVFVVAASIFKIIFFEAPFWNISSGKSLKKYWNP